MISSSDSIVDSRDAEKRINALVMDLTAAGIDPLLTIEEYNPETSEDDWTDEVDELGQLKRLREDVQNCCKDWDDGACLINKDYWEAWCEQYADDIGAINSEVSWPLNHINWEAAGEDLLSDYGEVTWDHETFYVRRN